MKKIIHLDNSSFFRKIVKMFLTSQGFLVESYGLGTAALNAIDRDTALIITALTFSDMDGEKFIKQAMRCAQNVPIIILTASRDAKVDMLLQSFGLKDIILK